MEDSISNKPRIEILPSSEENKPRNVSPEVQNKIVRLFTYLEKALAVDDSVIRDFRTSLVSPSPWWLADLPRDVENLYIRPFATEKSDPDLVAANGPWLRVEKKTVEAPPLAPSDIAEWLTDINPLTEPKAQEKIDRKIFFSDDRERVDAFKEFKKNFKQGDKPSAAISDWVTLTPGQLPKAIEERYVEDKWSDHPELQDLLIGYTENEWKPWADRVKKIYQTNLFYDQLYALRLLLKNEGDSHELLIGQGILTWQHSGVGSIFAPLFLTPVTLDFDPQRRVIEISPDPMFKGFVELAFLQGMDNPAEMDLITWSDKINADPFDFWHFESLKAQSRALVNYISNQGEDKFTDEILAAPEMQANPCVWNAPVLFARKRTNDLWSKYAGIIRRDIEQNSVEPTEFITDLIGEYDAKSEGVSAGESAASVSISESELFFPLPWNDEQKRIAERLDGNYGVVVKGPPGTGKSHTIANLIARFLAQGKSVLVTSQTSKALEVLRDKLPENIRSLAVSQLHQTAKRDDVLQQSIGEISSNLGERQTKFSEARATSVRNELQKVREEKSKLASEIRQYILSDSSQKISIDGQEIRPMQAAKLISENTNNEALDWFTDRIHHSDELQFSGEDLNEIYQLSLELNPDERKLFDCQLPEPTTLPSIEAVRGACLTYEKLEARINTDDLLADLSQEQAMALADSLENATKVLTSINKDYELEIFKTCIISQNECEKWNAVLEKIGEKIQVIGKAKNKLIGHEIAGKTDSSPNDFLEAVSILEAKLTSKSKLGTFGKLLLPGNVKELLERFSIDGCAPDTLERVKTLREVGIIRIAEKEIGTLLNQSFSDLKSPPELEQDPLNLIQLEVLITSLKRVVNYRSDFLHIDEFFKNSKRLTDLSYAEKSDIQKALDTLQSHIARLELAGLDRQFDGWISACEKNADAERSIVGALVASIQERSSDDWQRALEQLTMLQDKQSKAARLKVLADRVSKSAPNLYQDIVELADAKAEFMYPDNLQLAWKIARLASWLDVIHDHADIDALQNQLERLTKREYELNANLVTILAWQRQIDKVSKKQRDALMAWSYAMKKYGKGTGKYANKWLHAAQESLKEAKNAVPVWIMPLHRAVQMFSEPKAGMFDVVIFDEASQCDIRGLTIGYLGKKLLVVGDPDQISPAGVFQDQEKSFELISRFLFDVPHRDNFSITSSLFDLAKIRIPNMIQLNEHFRCVPEIIAFSNHYIYESKLKPLRHPHPKGLLKPALAPILVEEGYENTNNKVNEPEAKAIVEKLVQCLDDPNYQKRPDGRPCTFGVVSLLADDQAKYIKDLILKHPKIGEKIIEERKITCGDAYAFQGDERDVIFLSMVKALDPNKENDTVRPLVDKGAAQRFNVAITRARDQAFLFHSIPLHEFKNQADWRYRLLNWFYDPKQEELNAGREALKREFNSGRASQFSFDVGNILIDRGYQVLPEYPVIGYRIDLVVQGSDARLAVECDGDQYHTLENWDEDQARERQLRRAGWEFWRVTGSAFYRHKEKALDSLWKKLEELGIKPLVDS